MGIWSVVKDGAKFVFKHRKEIAKVATAAKDTASFVSDIKQKKGEHKTEKEYVSSEEENEPLESVITEMAEGITALEELYNGKVQELESAMDNIGSDFTATKEDFGNQLKVLNENLAQLKKVHEIYQKKMDTRLLLLSVCGGIGIFLAIILAIVL